MVRRVVIIEGHPDPAGKHLCNALANAYAHGAEGAGHEVRRINIAELEFPWLRTKEEFDSGPLPLALQSCQERFAAPIIWRSSILCGWGPCRP
jgi:putative NADPH-quinone reductase